MDNQEPQEDDRRKRLVNLAEALLAKRDEAVRFRAASGVELRWKQDQQAFDGLDASGKASMLDYATGEAQRGGTGPIRSKVRVNTIRGRVETAVGRFIDILFPADDKNWGMKPTPVPELVKGMSDDRQVIDTSTGQPMVGPDGAPVRASEVARAKMDQAKESMAGMQDEVDDQLTECHYGSECRKMVQTACKLGTGVLKGPMVVKSVKKRWQKQVDAQGKTVHTLQAIEEPKPASKSVSPWNVYPDPQCGSDVTRAAYIWEYDEILPRELRSLSGLQGSGYFDDQIELVLKENPVRTQAGTNKEQQYEIKRAKIDKGYAYEWWEYHGDVDRDDLEALGCKCEDLQGQSLSACVVFVNDRPVKIQLHILDSSDVIYDFFQWTPVDGSPWGIGLPRMAIWWDRVMTAVWRAIMDNARDSSGGNVVIGSGVQPMDGVMELTGKKIWRVTDGEDARTAFNQFQLSNNQADLVAIIELALKFMDIETQIPMLFQGEKSNDIPDVLGIVEVMVDSSNVALRSRVKLWDDQVTVPHITRYYHWNMQYADKEEIKGDYNVDARGASVLLERDKKARAIIQAFNLRGTPEVDAEVDWAKATRKLFEALKLDVLKSEADKKKAAEEQEGQEQPADPKIQAAQIRAQGEMEKAQLAQQMTHEEHELKAQLSQQEMAFRMQIKEMELQMKMMELSQSSGLALDKIKAQLSVEASKQGLMRELAQTKAQAPQMATPPIEPPGRAREGRAFQE
jgi:hypothetical protein